MIRDEFFRLASPRVTPVRSREPAAPTQSILNGSSCPHAGQNALSARREDQNEQLPPQAARQAGR